MDDIIDVTRLPFKDLESGREAAITISYGGKKVRVRLEIEGKEKADIWVDAGGAEKISAVLNHAINKVK